jgi:uncharacterized protein
MRRYKQSRYNYHINVGDKVVLHNFLTAALIEISPTYYDRITQLIAHPDLQHSMDDDLFLLLRSHGFIVPSSLDETDVLKYRYYSYMFGEGSNQLALVILPTLWCNLRCPYCFEVRRQEFMNDKTKQHLLEFIDYKLEDAKSLCVTWFGGEPLLCKTTIEELSKRFRQLSEQHHCIYEAGITTNGYLLDTAFISSMEQMGISSVQITFDGAPQHHDSYRVLPDGKGTFNTIKENTENLCRLTQDDFQLEIRINCSEGNFKDIPKLLSLFSAEVKNKVKIFFRWIYQTEASGFADFTYGIADRDRFGILAELSQGAIASGWSVDDPVSAAPIYCEADSTNFFQISPTGDVFLCTDTYERAESVGNISEWRRWVSFPTYEWYAANPFDDPGCLKCMLLPYCMGGCRKSRVGGRKSCVDELDDIEALVHVLYKSSLNQYVAA